MYRRIFALLALAISLFGTQCWACVPGEVPLSCTNTFDPNDTTGTFDFSATGDGIVKITFKTVLTTFMLTATINHTIDPISTDEFPAGTVAVTYANGQMDEYDFSGNAGGPNGVPVKGVDYVGLINAELIYFTNQTVHTPAFGHAPGDNATATFTEDILTGYSVFPLFTDPTMCGTLPGLSTLAALDEPLVESDTYCLVSPTSNQTFTVGQVIEVTYQLFSTGTCVNNTGTPIRDKTAHLTFSTMDAFGNTVLPAVQDKEEGNKFHWDNKSGLNEFDLSTVGLTAGTYTISVRSSKFSPQSVNVTLQ